jgi:non-specific serine/threonine protein kinase
MTSQGGNLPSGTGSFIGRAREIADVKRLLTHSRLLTLTGVAGVGKTSLALHAAAGYHRAFTDGVWLVDLTKLSDARLFTQTVAEALEVRETSRREPLDILVDHVRDRQLLIVLDNCEHLLYECAVLAETLLAAAPELRILATSRQRLNVASEQTMFVPPLSAPEAGWTPPSTKDLTQFEAVALFVERAAAVQKDFTLNEHNRDAVMGICRRLDGIPLAIELAAVRLPVLSPEQIVKRMDDRYELLTTGPREAEPRHQTLQNLIDWSFELCSGPERLFWARSSMFVGSFDLDAAEAVCRGEGIETAEIMDLVGDLIDKSILVREEHGDVVRYRQLETIRQYGRRRLNEIDEESSVRLRHREHFQRVADQTAREVFGPRQVKWFGRLQWDHADLRAALEHSLAAAEGGSSSVRFAADLLYHWLNSYYLNEGRDWLDRALAVETAPTEARAEALWSNGWLALLQDDLPSAKAMLAEARSLGEQLDLPRVLGYVDLFAGHAEMIGGNQAEGLALSERSLARQRAIGNQHGIVSSLIRLCMSSSYVGDSDQAIAYGEECLRVCDAVGDIWHKSYALLALSIEWWRQEDVGRATALARESLGFHRDLNDWVGVVLNIRTLILAAASKPDHAHAARLLGVLQSLQRSLGVTLTGYTYIESYLHEYVEEIRASLGDQRFEACVREGAELTSEEAIVLASGEEAPRPSAVTDEEPMPLSGREWEVAALVAQGHANKEIANKLVISQRTVESHVEHILTKLDFRSRAQIAGWYADHTRESEA